MPKGAFLQKKKPETAILVGVAADCFPLDEIVWMRLIPLILLLLE